MSEEGLNVIVVLGYKLNNNGTPCNILVERARTAAALYHSLDGNTRRVILPTGHGGTSYVTEAEAISRIIRTEGNVPEEDIILEEQAHSTVTNGTLCWPILRDLVKEHGRCTLHLVTSSFHMARSRYIFTLLFKPLLEMNKMSIVGHESLNTFATTAQADEAQAKEEQLLEFLESRQHSALEAGVAQIQQDVYEMFKTYA